MKKNTIIMLILIVFAGGMLYAHRRVIKAFLNNEPMPKAPKWHFWVKQEERMEN
ncbi:MAG: hypothetical protein K5879_01110 [Lachnospiraceae bacterium]|nr:hypothetical protein [Lachnospiraceae bacterium]